MQELTIKNLHVEIAEQKIIRGLSMSVPRGEVHAIRDRMARAKAPWPRFWPAIPIIT
jgi:ABC-type histidine transport system ATPase subunit